eukprot:ANDGO_04959.mRNA.1 mitochondrial Phosphoenolpyruvate carboxykinase [GTP]
MSKFDDFYATVAEKTNGNTKLMSFLKTWIDICDPDAVRWCSGSAEESKMLSEQLVNEGSFIRLNEHKRPNSYLARSAPSDVARVEARTFICCEEPEDAGPTNNWRYPGEMMPKIKGLMNGAMVGRTLYVIPFVMGPLGSPLSHVGVQITDSAYVVVSMRIMTIMGDAVLPYLKNHAQEFVPCVHSVGCPIHKHEHMHLDIEAPAWPCDRDGIKFITHFPDDAYGHMIVSYGSGYGGNALLGKKCFALRIASILSRKQGNALAEHMLVAGITVPGQPKQYIAAAFPSSCGKTNLAMLSVAIPGWKWECVGDDIMWARVRPEKDGRMYAINPEQGIFGVAPGCGNRTLPNAISAIRENAIFTNVGLTPDGDVWWEGLTKEVPAGVIDWQGKPFVAGKGAVVAHPNARFTAPIQQCPTYDIAHKDPEGVPLSAILFGGRRSRTVPLVFEALSWDHGVFLGSTMRSEGTAAADTAVGALRYDPFAMLPFCAYNMGDYFGHWVKIGAQFPSEDKQPRFFYVNWFRRDENNAFLWPGFSENARVVKWILERCRRPREDSATATKTPIGYIPTRESLDLEGLDISSETIAKLFAVNLQEWREETDAAITYLQSTFGSHVPPTILEQAQAQNQRIAASLLSSNASV